MTANAESFRIMGRELQVQRMVGSGGFGDVLLVSRLRAELHPRHGFTFPPLCVVKVMRMGLCDQGELEQAQREVRTLKSLDHPNIVRYIGSWIEASRGPYHNRFCLALQYCEGGDMTTLVRRCTDAKRLVPPDVAVRLMAQVFSALNYSHSRNLIHRDIKPGNVFLTARGEDVAGDAVVGDYGLVRSLEVTREAVATRVGTPSYISPEIVAGEPYTAKTDIFSAGTMFYELLTLSRPFWRKGIAENQLFQAVLDYDPMPRFARLVRDAYGPVMADVMRACLEKRERDRASAYDVLVRIASPVSVYVRNNAIPVFVEKYAASPPAACASSPSVQASPDRAEPPCEDVAAPMPAVTPEASKTVRESLDELFITSLGPAPASRLVTMLAHDPELLFQVRVLIACRHGDRDHLRRGLRDMFAVYKYGAETEAVISVINFIMRNYRQMIS